MGGGLDKSSVTVEEVEGSGVGKLRDNEGTLETSSFSTNVVLRGLRVGGINVIIMGVAGAVEQRLEVGGERHWVKGKRERGVRKRTKEGSHL